VIRRTSFLGCEIGRHGKIEGGVAMIMRIVLVDLEAYSIRGVGIEVEAEVVLPDRAMLGRGSPPA
jgi:hypothetical protein